MDFSKPSKRLIRTVACAKGCAFGAPCKTVQISKLQKAGKNETIQKTKPNKHPHMFQKKTKMKKKHRSSVSNHSRFAVTRNDEGEITYQDFIAGDRETMFLFGRETFLLRLGLWFFVILLMFCFFFLGFVLFVFVRFWFCFCFLFARDLISLGIDGSLLLFFYTFFLHITMFCVLEGFWGWG